MLSRISDFRVDRCGHLRRLRSNWEAVMPVGPGHNRAEAYEIAASGRSRLLLPHLRPSQTTAGAQGVPRASLELRHGLVEAHVAMGTVRRDCVPAPRSGVCHLETHEPQGLMAFRARNLEQAPKRRNCHDNDHYCTNKPDNEGTGANAHQSSRHKEKGHGAASVLRAPSHKKLADGHVGRSPRWRQILFDPSPPRPEQQSR
jgi:hypothetical protein